MRKRNSPSVTRLEPCDPHSACDALLAGGIKRLFRIGVNSVFRNDPFEITTQRFQRVPLFIDFSGRSETHLAENRGAQPAHEVPNKLLRRIFFRAYGSLPVPQQMAGKWGLAQRLPLEWLYLETASHTLHCDSGNR